LIKPTRAALDEIVKGFAPAAVSAGDVIGQRQAAFNNYFALTPKIQRLFVKQLEKTDHLRQI
jgi:hypothetical protein